MITNNPDLFLPPIYMFFIAYLKSDMYYYLASHLCQDYRRPLVTPRLFFSLFGYIIQNHLAQFEVHSIIAFCSVIIFFVWMDLP